MNKTIIAPIVGFLVIIVELAFHVKIPEDVVAQITNVILTGASLGAVIFGIVTNHKKE